MTTISVHYTGISNFPSGRCNLPNFFFADNPLWDGHTGIYIVDGTHYTIECEGTCKAWLHRGCAGLSKAVFQATTSSPDPFLCSHCRFVAQPSELLALKMSVNTLSNELSSLKAVVDELKAKATLASPPVWVNVPNTSDFSSAFPLPWQP